MEVVEIDIMKAWQSLPLTCRVGFICVGFILVLSLLTFISKPPPIRVELQSLVRQAAQLFEMSKQDSDPVVSLQHSTQALTYLSIARKFATDAEIEHACKVKPQDLESVLLEHQTAIHAKLSPKELSITGIAAEYYKV